MHDTTRSQNISEKVEQVLEIYGFHLSKLECLSSDGAANMVCRHNNVAPKLRTKIEDSHSNLTFTHFHSIIHQQNLCSEILKFYYVLTLVTDC